MTDERADESDRPSGSDTNALDGSFGDSAEVRRLTPGQLIGGGLAVAAVVALVVTIALVMRGLTPSGGIGVISLGRALDLEARPAPDFALTTFDGRDLRLSDYRGQVVVLNFWASWCPPCRVEAPVLERGWQTYRDQGMVLIGIDVWDDEADALRFLAEFGVSYPNAEDTTRMIPVEYGVTGLPETYVIDRQGVLIRRWVGPLNDEQFAKLIEPVLAGEATP